MSGKAKKKQEDEVVVETTPEEGQAEVPRTGKRTKKVPAEGKRHRSGPRHRENRSRGYHHLLHEEHEEADIFS